MKDNKVVVDVNQSVKESTREAFQHVCGTMLVVMLFAFLLAPLFLAWFKPDVEQYYQKVHGHGYTKMPLVQASVAKTMTKINLVLWTVAIVGWGLVLLCAEVGYAD